MSSPTSIILNVVLLVSSCGPPVAAALPLPAGFSLEPLAVDAGQINYRALAMYLPAAQGFAPKSNVQVQADQGAWKDYLALSQPQMRKRGLKLLTMTNLDANSAVGEYSAKIQGYHSPWYGKLICRDHQVYLARVPALAKPWPRLFHGYANALLALP